MIDKKLKSKIKLLIVICTRVIYKSDDVCHEVKLNKFAGVNYAISDKARVPYMMRESLKHNKWSPQAQFDRVNDMQKRARRDYPSPPNAHHFSTRGARVNCNVIHTTSAYISLYFFFFYVITHFTTDIIAYTQAKSPRDASVHDNDPRLEWNYCLFC